MVRSLLARSPLGFFLLRRRYSRRLRESPTPSAGHRDQVQLADAVRRRGICMVEGYMDRRAVGEIVSEALPILMHLKESGAHGDLETSSFPEYGTYVLHHFEALSEAARGFLDDEMIHAVVGMLTGGRGVPYDTRAELRMETKKNLLVDDWHSDTWKFRLKAMLYLSDVGESNGPLRYLAGSHDGSSWRMRRFWFDYLGNDFGEEPTVQRFLVREAERQCRNRNFREIVCAAPAGTLILFDARGLHSATTPREGSRLVLNRAFVLRDDLA